MAISDYPTLTTLHDDDMIPFVNENATFAVSIGTIKNDSHESMLPVNFGTEYAGKILTVGPDGFVRPM